MLIDAGDESAAVCFYCNQSNKINPFEPIEHSDSLFAKAIRAMPILTAEIVKHKDIEKYINVDTGSRGFLGMGHPLLVAVSCFKLSAEGNQVGNNASFQVLMTVPGLNVNLLHESFGIGLTALHMAAKSSNVKAVKLLLNAEGIDPEIKDSEHKTAAECAGSAAVTQLFEKFAKSKANNNRLMNG